jgi:cytochrome c biogenesis protein CcmG/thiol:disulfide interchange protein DsbE
MHRMGAQPVRDTRQSAPAWSNIVTEPTSKKSTNLWTRVAVWGTIVVILAFLGWGLLKRSESRPEVGDEAPNFTLQLFDGYYDEFQDGKVTLVDLRGRVVVINFWASWCVECRVEAKELEETWLDYRDEGVVFIGVDFDDTEVKAIGYLKEFGITYPNGLDGRGQITDSTYHITGVPETFVVDPTGKIVLVKIGPFQPGELRRTIEELLAAS